MADEGPPSDRELMKQLESGDLSPLGELFVRYGRMVSCVVSTYLAPADQGERDDVCQEVFLTVVDIAPRYRDEGKLASLLRGIAVRKARAFCRKRWLRRVLLSREKGPPPGIACARASTLDDTLAHREELVRLIEHLPAAQREVILLRFVEEMDDIEIAAALGISRATVGTRLHRARHALSKLGHGGDA